MLRLAIRALFALGIFFGCGSFRGCCSFLSYVKGVGLGGEGRGREGKEVEFPAIRDLVSLAARRLKVP